MAVSQNRFVNIVSGVGAGQTVPVRQLILRLFTSNPLLPPNTIKEFTSASDVGAYFGTTSQEYLRALFYFSWVSKNVTQPQRISFSRWVEAAQAGLIYGAQAAYALATFTAISSGSIKLTIGETTAQLTSIDLTGAANLAAVAALIQAAIRAHTAGGSDWTAATVTYSPTPTQGGQPQFVLTGGVTGAEAMGIVAATAGTDIGPLTGLLNATAIIGQGSAVETITDTLDNSAEISNNFGSFAFVDTLSTDQITEAATWNNGQNVLYMFLTPVSAANAASVSAAIGDLAGTAMTLSPIANEYPELIPGLVLAATDYNSINAVQNYEFQLNFDITPSVLNDADADTYDALSVNYYLQTQSAGTLINFYATGVLTGGTNTPTDQNTYANEQWLKDDLAAALLTLQLALPQISANLAGISQVTNQMQPVLSQAKDNGTIIVGKPLDSTQQLYIANITGSNTAYLQVQNNGYWLNVVIVPYVVDAITKYKINYTLIYSKDDVIRLIEGRDILI